MRNVQRWGAWLCAALLLAGCGRPAAAPPPERAPAKAPAKGKPQPKLPTTLLVFGGKDMTAEIARTPKEIEAGMMWRTEMGENDGMIFVFDYPRQVSFWMKNTLVPLSCAYIDSEGVILELHDMKPRDETPIVASTDRVQYVLEVPQGWFRKNQIPVGTVIQTSRGTLRDTLLKAR